MPELPEVETIVRDLNKKVLNRAFIDVWTDVKKLIKKPSSFEEFKKQIRNKKIKKIWRRGKNIIFDLSDNYSLLIHQKLTGHLLLGKWQIGPTGYPGKWQPLSRGPLEEPVNRYIHFMFWLSGDLMLAFSDLRKFAKVELWRSDELKNSEEFKGLGPEPLEKNFTFNKFKEVLRRAQGKIKQVLMDQTVIAGIGNIYSDEILWETKIHPFKEIKRLNDEEIKKIYQAMKKILTKAIKLGGESISDFRRPSGEKGYFDSERKVYRREGEKCGRCGTIIKRLKLGGRSAHYCPNCQPIR